MPDIHPFLWFDTQAEDAAEFYVTVFPNSRVVDSSARMVNPWDLGAGPASEIATHNGPTGVRAADLVEATGKERPHRSREQGRCAHPDRLEGVGIDRMTLDGGGTMMVSVSNRCVQQRSRNAD